MLALFLALFFCLSLTAAKADSSVFVVGHVRIETLSSRLVRLEVQGPNGFEDRKTLHIVNRDWPGLAAASQANGDNVEITTPDYVVSVPENASSLTGITITDPAGTLLWRYDSLPSNRLSLPGPRDNLKAWAIADTPRMVPPAWGYNPAPSGHTLTNGWDLTNDAPDMYVFLPKDNLRQLREDFNALTGPTEMVPLHALGARDSRYFEYTDQTALQQIKDYRDHQFPLDNLVIDTDWRVGGGEGYDVNTRDFPDIKHFFAEAHENHVWVMFNDHPNLSPRLWIPKEVALRNAGTRSILDDGLDIWWYDRNWKDPLASPPGLNPDEWGMYVYNSVMADYFPTRRPITMENIDGLSPEIMAHRYDIQWRGDIVPGYPSLHVQVELAVDEGIYGDFP